MSHSSEQEALLIMNDARPRLGMGMNRPPAKNSAEGPPHSSPSTVTAGAAAVGSGTLLVLLANNLSNGNPWKSWLVLLAPSVSIAVSVIYEWARVSINRYSKKRELRAVVQQAKQTLQEALHDPSTSLTHRLQLTKELEQLELLLVQADMEKIKKALYH